MIWASTLLIRRHEYFSHLNFIISIVGTLLLYVINLNVASRFIIFIFNDVKYVVVFYVLHQFEER